MNRWMYRYLIPLSWMCCLGLVACKEKPKTGEGTDEAQKPFVPSKPPLPKLSDDLVEASRTVIDACGIDEQGNPGKCNGGELTSYKRMLGKQRMKLFPQLVEGLYNDDLKIQQLTAYAFEDQVPYFIGDANKKDYTIPGEDKRIAPIDRDAALRLVEKVKTYDPDKDSFAIATIEAAVAAGTLAGLDDEVRDLLSRFDPQKSEANKWVYYKGMRATMRYGRLRFFPDVKAMLEHPMAELRTLAFEAPMQMSYWDNGESEEVCQWAQPLMKQDEPSYNAGPARLLLRCNDANSWRNMLLDEAAIRYNEGRLTRPFTTVLCRVCTPPIAGQFPPAGDTVCNRGEEFLTKVTGDAKVAAEDRSELLSCLAQYWANGRTIAHLEKLTSDADPKVSAEATRLATALKPREAAPTAPATPGAPSAAP